MKLSGIKKLVVTIALLGALAISFSSCNRGIGCPSDFSVKQLASPVVNSVFHLR